jgi:cytochrome P450
VNVPVQTLQEMESILVEMRSLFRPELEKRRAQPTDDFYRLDFTRNHDRNMSFGPGLHHCIGHLLAKMELGEFFPELLRRFDLELLDERLHFGPVIAFRGLDCLRLKLHRRH